MRKIGDHRYEVTINGYTFKCRLSNAGGGEVEEENVVRLQVKGEKYLHLLPSSPRDMFNGDGPDLDSWRPGQREVAAFAVASDIAMLFDGVYIDAPTGSGKSVIAQAIAQLHRTMDPESRVVVATLDHGLQEQYAQTEAIGSLTGRNNWPCLVDPEKTAANAMCTTRIKPSACELYNHCPYFMQKKQALAKPAMVTNYAWLQQGGGTSISGYTLVADEAHMAEQVTRESEAVAIKVNTIFPPRERIKFVARGQTAIPPLRDPLWHETALRRINEVGVEVRKMISVNSRIPDGGEEDPYLDTALKHAMHEYNVLRRALSKLRPADNEIYWAMDGDQLRLEPLIMAPYIYGAASSYYLSATIIDPTVVAPNDPLLFIEMPSSFPKERRPVKVQRVAKMGAKATELDLQAMASFIDNTLIKHNNEKGVIHCVSYSLAEELKARSKYPQMLISHKPGERDRAIAEFKAAPMGRALLSPSVSTGLDLPDDLCRFQVIAKMPFLNMGDPILKARMENFPDAANLDVARTIVQAAGRGMRSETDHCVTYIADANFGWFYKQNQRFFPDWFREAVV